MRTYRVDELAAMVGVEPADVASVDAVGTGSVTVREGDYVTARVVRGRQETVPTGPSGLTAETTIETSGELQFGVRTRSGAITWTPPLAEPEPEREG